MNVNFWNLSKDLQNIADFRWCQKIVRDIYSLPVHILTLVTVVAITKIDLIYVKNTPVNPWFYKAASSLRAADTQSRLVLHFQNISQLQYRRLRRMYKILVIEPYFGGSHRHFLTRLQQNIKAELTFLTLPPRKWKLRMQLSAPWFAECVAKMDEKKFDTVLCSTFVDVAVLKALLNGINGWNTTCLYCTYFHENQFVYPHRKDDKARHQFTAINFNTALVSDRIAFNSHYNMLTFVNNCRQFIKKAADVDLADIVSRIEEKATVLYPGIDYVEATRTTAKKKTIPVICWNHRWEHDKNPEEFFNSLAELVEKGYGFKLIVLGQAFREEPPVFGWARQKFAEQTLHFGYVSSQKEYFRWLQRADIVVSTALHEFFGISVMEAVGAGCVPVVPDRLSYPELYPQYFRYQEGELSLKLAEVLDRVMTGDLPPMNIDCERYSWNSLRDDYSTWLMKT
jgi:glycosyltransferase involved in cell wall biosynthesis